MIDIDKLHEAAVRIATTAEEAVDAGLPGWQSVQDDAETIIAGLASGDLVPREEVEALEELEEAVRLVVNELMVYDDLPFLIDQYANESAVVMTEDAAALGRAVRLLCRVAAIAALEADHE